ncbi:hypothetical protein, partial [uncultured Fusobacterium sp.]|uniref:hypothetical protein n=1 Tax=uncultured Fusobacterium sp. TaxID=159267 RepID=UPI0025FBE332
MSNEIKSIQIVDTENLIKELNSKFQNLDKIYKIFEEEVGNNKWTSIPNKNLYFNKEIIACYPNFLNNFQDIYINKSDGYNKALEIIKNNQEYSKYGIDWDIQTQKESYNSFNCKWHPMESDGNHQIGGRCYIIYKNQNSIYGYDNDPGYGNSTERGLLVPIYRLGIPKDYELLEKNSTIFNYP